MPTEQARDSSGHARSSPARPVTAPWPGRAQAGREGVARCSCCGARTIPDVPWCGQCHTPLGSQVPGAQPARGGDLTEGGGPTAGSAIVGRGEPVEGDALVGGRVPDEVIEGLMSRLAEESEPVLPSRALAFTGKPWRIALAAGGGLALALILVGVPALLGRLL